MTSTKQVVVDSLLTTYRLIGDGHKRPLLVLHGWGDSSANWLEFGTMLAGNPGKYDVYIVDLPGFGSTERPAVAWGLDDYAAFAGQFLQKINLKPAVIVGHSNGGAIAIRGLANGVLQADKLVLLASAGVRSEYKGRKKAIRLLAKTGKLLATPLPDAVKRRMRRTLYTTVGSDMLVVESLQETFKRVVNDDVQTDAARLGIPSLLIYGENDVSTPPQFGMLLHQKLNGSTLEIIGDAEHFVHQDQPQKVLALMRGFLD